MAGALRRTDRGSRLIAASPQRIWRAFTVADELMRWLPPQGMSGRLDWLDLRPGGGYRMTLTYDDPSGAPGKSTAASDTVEVRFAELVPGERLVQMVDFVADDPAFSGTMTMRWELAPAGEGTLVTITAENVPPGISAPDHEAGLRSSLENLAALVE